MSTQTTAGAREHARSQAGTITDSMPVLPATRWPNPPEDVAPERLTWAETVPGGRYTTKVLARGTRLRLRDIAGSACANILLYRADAPWERLNVADTVKVPWQAYLGVGHPLLSDQGRVLATVVADTSGHHDAFCGTTSRATNEAKYGQGSLHSASPAGRELFTVAAAKNGLGPQDIAPPLSFFHGVRVEADGALTSTGVRRLRRNGRPSDSPARHRDDRQHRAPTRSGAAVSHHVPRSARVEGRRRTRQP